MLCTKSNPIITLIPTLTLMKKLFKGVLVAAAAMSLYGTSAAEDINIGDKTCSFTRVVDKQVAPGVQYTYFNCTSRGTYGTHVWVTTVDLTNPDVKIEYLTAGGTMGGSTKSLEAIAAANTATGHKVVAGANANFWVTSETPWKSQLSLYPHGTAVSNGVQYSINPSKGTDAHMGGPTATGSIAIGTDGRAYIRRFLYHNFMYHARINHSLDITDCNRVVEAGTASVYTPAYGRSKAFKPVNASGTSWVIVQNVCTEVLLDLAPGQKALAGGHDVKYIVKEVRKNAGTGTIGDHDLAIVGRDSYADLLATHYQVGDEIVWQQHMLNVDGTTPDVIPTMQEATSGNCVTMENGTIYTSDVNSSGYNTSVYARTLYGTNDDGTKLWIAVCGNKTSTYYGMTTLQMTYLLKHLGATYASQVDCGGSSQMYAGGSQVNQSTDGTVRPVHSGMFVVSTATEATTTPTITTTATNIDFGRLAVGGGKSQKVTVNGSNLEGDITFAITGTDAKQFTVIPNNIAGVNGGGTTTVSYGPTVTGSHTATLTISSKGANSITLTLNGTATEAETGNGVYPDEAQAYGVTASASYDMMPEYTDRAIEQLAGKKVKRVIARGDILYILAHGTDAAQTPVIVVYNHTEGKVVRTLGTANATKGTPCVSDIAMTADGYLVGMGYAYQAYGGTAGNIIYKWLNNDTDGLPYGEPFHWQDKINNGGNYSHAMTGSTIAMDGAVEGGKLVYSAFTCDGTTHVPGGNIRFAVVTTKEANSATAIHNNFNSVSGYGNISSIGQDFLLFPSPYSANNVIVQSNKKWGAEFALSGSKAGIPTLVASETTSATPSNALHTGMFRYGGKIYMTAPSFASSTTSNGVLLVDITDGLNQQKAVSAGNTVMPEQSTTDVQTVGTGVITRDETGKFLEARMALFAVRGGAVTKFITPSTLEGLPEPQIHPASNTIDFGAVYVHETLGVKSVLVEGIDLRSDITAKVEGKGFELDPETSTISSADARGSIAVAFNPTAEGTYTAKLILSTVGTEDVVITLKGSYGKNPALTYGERAHHAYNLNVSRESDGLTVLEYTLTGDVKNVRVHLTKLDEPLNAAKSQKRIRRAAAQGDYDYTFEQGAKSAGTNQAEIHHQYIDADYYHWTVEVESYPVATSGPLYHYAPQKLMEEGTSKVINGGVAVVTDPESPAYGKIVTSNGFAQGFMVFTPEHQYEGTYCANTATWATGNQRSIYRIAMRPDGKMYASDYGDGGAGIWCFDPADPDAGTYNIFTGTKDSGGCWTRNGVALGGGGQGLCFTGSGDQTQLWSYQEDYPTSNTTDVVCRYDIGQAELITEAPTIPNTRLKKNGILLNNNVNLVGDGDHGLFVLQNRGNGNNVTSCPIFVYVDQNGNELYNSASQADIVPSGGPGLALSADRSLLALSDVQGADIRLYDVTWAANGAPELTARGTIPGSANNGGLVNQMAFDNAGNLLAYNSTKDETQAGLNVYSLSHPAPVASTPASFVARFDGTSTGVTDITVESAGETAAPIYYNIRGMRMPSGQSLAPGLYIKVTGTKVEKVRIK